MLCGWAAYVMKDKGAWILIPIGIAIFYFVAQLKWLRSYLYQFRIFETQTYDWYSRNHPESVSAGKTVACFKCRSSKINLRNIMNGTYHRAHVCANCGSTLYFSAE